MAGKLPALAEPPQSPESDEGSSRSQCKEVIARCHDGIARARPLPP